MFNPYPNNASDITTEWLNAALTESDHPSAGMVTQCDAKLLDTEGNTGWYALAVIESDPGSGLPDSLFFKVATKYDVNISSQYQNYSTEIAFYRDISSKFPGQFLQFIYGNADEETDQGVVVIEAFDPKFTLNTFKGVAKREALLALRSMGVLQGNWWNRPMPESLIDQTPESFLNLIKSIIDLIRPAWPTNRTALTTVLPAAAIRAIDKLLESTPDFLQQFAGSPVTVNQVDSRAENFAILERDGTDRLVIFDWQRATLGPAITDPAYFIATSVLESDQANYSTLLDEYLAAVANTGVELPPRAQAEHILALGSVSALAIRLASGIISGELKSWIDSGFVVEDGNWQIQTIIRTANFVDVLKSDAALTSG